LKFGKLPAGKNLPHPETKKGGQKEPFKRIGFVFQQHLTKFFAYQRFNIGGAS
jgi:hypothetical protein